MKSRSPRSFAWVAFASVLIMLSLPGGAVAQAAEDERAEGTDAAYDDAIAEAVDAYERADYEATLRAFTRAHVLFPNARTHRGLGIVHYALGDYPRAVDELNAALASSVAPLDDALREQTQRLRDAAAQRAEAGPPGGVPETGGVPDDQRDDASSDEPERPPMEASLAPEAVAPAMVETSGSSPSLELIEPRPRVRRTRVAWALAGTAYGAAALAVVPWATGRARINSLSDLCASQAGGGCTVEQRDSEWEARHIDRLRRSARGLAIAGAVSGVALTILAWRGARDREVDVAVSWSTPGTTLRLRF